MTQYDKTAIQTALTNRWPEFATASLGIPAGALTGEHGPCPKCGGRDRWRVFEDFSRTGGAYCNKCGTHLSDGIALTQWWTGDDFPAAIKRLADFAGMSPARPKPQIEATYDYCDEQGKLLFQVCRMVPKDFRQRRPDGKGGWTWKTKGIRQVVYHLPKLLAEPERTTFIVEGEKDADGLLSLGLLATCNAGGAGKWRSGHAEQLRDRRVMIVPDRDEPGRKHAQQVALSLHGIASEVRVVELPGIGKDVTDWITTGGTREQLIELAKLAPIWVPSETSEPATAAASGPPFTTLSAASRRYLDTLDSADPLIDIGIPEASYALGGGVARGELVVIGARPSHGKSALALQCLHECAAQGLECLLVSEEMSALVLGQRTISHVSGVHRDNWRQDRHIVERQLDMHFAKRKPIHVVNDCHNIDAVRAAITTAVTVHNVAVVAVDYAQLITSHGRTPYEQVRNTSIALRQIANTHNLLMLLLCQLNRECELRTPFRPRRTDLKESGQLEQDADVILLCAYPHMLDKQMDPAEYQLFVEKNRNRQTNEYVFTCRFEPSRQRFVPGAQPVTTDQWVPSSRS